MRGFLSFLVDSLLPVSCVACGRDVAVGDDGPAETAAAVRGAAFDPSGCSYDLFAGIRIRARVLCPECWLRLERSSAGAELRVRGATVPIVSPFKTNDTLLALVRFLKFAGGRSSVPPLAWWMVRALRDHIVREGGRAREEARLVPVPLHPRRLRERGYNQAHLLAREIHRELGIPVEPDAVIRVKHTASQSSLEEHERSANVRGAFRLARPELVKGRSILLVDDLVTTGETARACIDAILGGDPASAAVLAAGRARETPSAATGTHA